MSIRQTVVIAILPLVGSHNLTAQDVAPCPTSVVPARVAGLELIGWQKFPREELKVRITYPEGRYTDEAVQAFISELLATLPKPAQPTLPPGDSKLTDASVDSDS